MQVHAVKVKRKHVADFPAVTICNVNRHRRSAFTLEDIAVMGPHLGFTDYDHNLLHPELYPEEWYNETFFGTDWDTIDSLINGRFTFIMTVFIIIDIRFV